jgi:hypothetical protein
MEVMSGRTAQEAVIEFLGAPSLVPALVGGGPVRTSRPAAVRPWSADLDTVEFLKERVVLGRRLYVVAFQADHVRRGTTTMTMLVRADRARGSWVARSMSGVSGAGTAPWTQPHVNLGGSWGRHGFCGGGRVLTAGAHVTRVRVRFANGVELEDDTDGGWVLFFTDQPVERPSATVELLDDANGVVSSFDWPWTPELPEELRRRIPKN